MFQSVRIENLRGVSKLDIADLGQVNLFVGENGCGKTTLLEGLFFLVGATNPRLPVNANVFRELRFVSNTLWASYFHKFDATRPIVVSAKRWDSEEEEVLRVDLAYSANRPIGLANGSVSTGRSEAGPDSGTPVEPDGLRLEYESSKKGQKKVVSTVRLRGNELVTEGAQQREIRGCFVNPGTIYDWKERFSAIQRKKQVEKVVLLLRKVEPEIIDLRLDEMGLLVADVGLPELVPVNLMGGGVAKLLSVAMAMLHFKDGVVLIDEMENGLYHSLQKTAWRSVLQWSSELNVQVFATTHSSECVKAFAHSADESLFPLLRRAKLFRIERKGENFRAVEYERDILAESIESNWEVR